MSDIKEIIKDFEFFDSWEDKYQFIIDLGRSLPKMETKDKIEKNKLKGCQSTVYFVTRQNKNNTLSFTASSDAFIVQGLIALILKIFNNKKPREIIDTNLDFLKKIGLEQHLSVTRKNGLSAMIDKIKFEAQSLLDVND